jgi:cobalt-zinc-cadmium efflux system outer membrane protein
MQLRRWNRPLLAVTALGCLCWPALVGFEAAKVCAGSPEKPGEFLPQVLTREAAVGWALRHNPELNAVRQQHGVAVAAVVIAQTYPFNPVWTSKLFAANGPASAGISNRLTMEQRVSIDLEVRGQGGYRRQEAKAGLSRTDWEIANQELLLAVRVVRAFDTVLYQNAKLQLAQESLRVLEQTADQVRRLVEVGRLQPSDLLLARSDVNSSGSALYSLRLAQGTAEQDLRVALGLTNEALSVAGILRPALPSISPNELLATALARRADLRASQAAVAEADARRRLAIADRYGNPNVGPDYERNETRVSFIGVESALPLPILNTHRGEIQQREAEHARAALEMRSVEVSVRQEVHAAFGRLAAARAAVDSYRTRVLPDLQANVNDMETLFGQGRVDLLKVMDIRRKLLRARDGYLDALFELRQAQDDLAAAVGDLTLALGPELERSSP